MNYQDYNEPQQLGFNAGKQDAISFSKKDPESHFGKKNEGKTVSKKVTKKYKEDFFEAYDKGYNVVLKQRRDYRDQENLISNVRGKSPEEKLKIIQDHDEKKLKGMTTEQINKRLLMLKEEASSLIKLRDSDEKER